MSSYVKFLQLLQPCYVTLHSGMHGAH